MIQQASLTWLADHELRLGWRDWVSLMTAGGRTRGRTAFVALIFIGIFMHVFAYWTVATYADAGLGSGTAALVGITGTLFLSWSLLLSQAMESVTRAFYSRSDLDLILTSPASARKVFAVRMGRIAMAAVAIAVLLAAPFINVLAALGGGRWLAAYGVVIAMGAVATATSSPTSAGGRPCCGEPRVPQAGVRLAPMLWQAAAVLTTQTGVGLPCLLHCAKMRVEPT